MRYLSILILVALVSCGADRPTLTPVAPTVAPTATPVPALRVLFIGNSLTYVNNLPNMVQSLANANGQHLDYTVIAKPDYALEDHWSDAKTRDLIKNGDWDVVVLQQGPSALPASRVNLREYAGTFATEIKQANARPALYTVWVDANRLYDFAETLHSYALAADDVGGLLLPAGDAWRETWRRDPCLKLYGLDQFHPSTLGSYLAALVIYAQLFDVAVPSTVPADLQLEIEPETHAILQAAATQAITQTKTLTADERYALPSQIPFCTK